MKIAGVDFPHFVSKFVHPLGRKIFSTHEKSEESKWSVFIYSSHVRHKWQYLHNK